ncbi:sulfatase-like hydrolase/transferase [Actinomadura sp. 21ATH]|uniref:sulfatase-like hydrolase/transferase n=1 Tax=Actinomadura sp. 21ATH TaxID=1735444 RepID=UPI0035C01A0C
MGEPARRERGVAERLMEVYAGFLEHTDVQVGRLIDELRRGGLHDDTLFVYIVGDNGSSAEGGLPGSINYMGALQGMNESPAGTLARLDEIGTAESYPQYPAGWAWAMTAPYQWVKQIASHLGGTRNPMAVTWPNGISGSGLRTQFSHVNDIAPTILEAAGLAMPEAVNGVVQEPMHGTSLVYSFDDPDAPERHTTQYFEVYGHRSLYHEGWMASAHHGGVPWGVGLPGKDRPFEDDVWELYDLEADFSQANDLAEAEPGRLAELQRLFEREAGRVGILPLRDARVSRTRMPNLARGRKSFTYYPGAVGIPESNAPRMLGRSWTLTAALETGDRPRGVIATMGGRAAGWSLYVDTAARPVFVYRTFELAVAELAPGLALEPGRHVLRVDFTADSDGIGRGGTLVLTADGTRVAGAHLAATPPAIFSIDETFDIGLNTGSPVGDHPPAFPFAGGEIERVDIVLD